MEMGGWSDRLREKQYKEQYVSALNRILQWDKVNNFEQIWEQMERTLSDCARGLCICKDGEKELEEWVVKEWC